MKSRPELFANLNAPYYVYAPPYRETSGGVRALHSLCHALNLLGEEAYVTTDVVSPVLRTPTLTEVRKRAHAEQNREPIVIYPEVIGDNPLDARHVVRYLLNLPSHLTGHRTYWAPDDMIYTHGTDVVPPGMQAQLLQTPLVNTRIFNRQGVDDSQRAGKLLFISRYLERGGQLTAQTDGCTEISSRVPARSPEQLADLYRSAELMYAYEPSTACYEALMCGCPVVYLPNPLLLPKPMHNYLTSAGSAWGDSDEQIALARRTVHDIPAIYTQLEDGFWQELHEFVVHTQQRARQTAPTIAITNTVTTPRKQVVVLSAEPPVSPCPYLRFTRPFALLEEQWELQWGIRGTSIKLDLLKQADLIVFQRYTPGIIPLSVLEQIFRLGKKIVYETDDLLHDVPDYHPQAASARQWREGIEYVARHADAVVVSTPYLQDKLRQLNANVHVLGNYLDFGMFYRPVPEGARQPLRIGMLGTSLQGPNFALVDQALRRVLQRHPGQIEVHFIGWAAPRGWENDPAARFLPNIDSYLDYARTLKELDWDIALVPLADDTFNFGKTAIKWMEYSAAGIASVFSDVSVYRGAVTQDRTGLLAANTPEAWFEAIERLVSEPHTRQRLAQAAQDDVRDHHSISGNVGRYADVYGSFLAAPAIENPVAHSNPTATVPAALTTPTAPTAPARRAPVIRPMTPARGRAPAAPATSVAAVVTPPIPPAPPASEALAAPTSAQPAATPGKVLRVAVCSIESTWSPCPQIRLILPFGFMDAQWQLEWAINEGRFDHEVLARADLVVMHRFTPGLLPQSDLETLLGSGKPVIYETDDLLNDMPDYHPMAADSRKWKPGIEYTVKHAHAVTVSTPFLAERYRTLNSNIHVLPNYLDFDRFYRPVPATNGATITIGLLGTSITGPNFALVHNALRVLCARFPDTLRLHLVGWECPAEWQGHPAVRYDPFIHAYQDYAAKLLEWQWDIALVPLVDDDFNHSKSAIKYLEYAAAGIATAFSDVSVYNKVVEDGRTGLLVEQSQGAWLQAIESLVKQPVLRRQLARTAQADVRRHHALRENAWRYEAAYRSFAGLAPLAPPERQRTPAILLLDRSGDAVAVDAALKGLDEGKQSWLPKVVLTTQSGELPAGSEQLRYAQFTADEFDAALALLSAHEDFDWYAIIETAAQ